MASRIDTSFAWYTVGALWLLSIPMVLRLVCFGIEGLTRHEALFYFPWMIPNIFLTLGLVTGDRRLLIPMIALFLLLVVIFPISTVYTLCTVLLPNAFFYILSGLTGMEYGVACGACLWDALGRVLSDLLVSVAALIFYSYFYKLMKSHEDNQGQGQIDDDSDDDDDSWQDL